MIRWGLLILIVFNSHGMQRYLRINGKQVSDEDLAQSTDFVKENDEYNVSSNEIVAVLFNKKWIYAQVIFEPSKLSNYKALLGRSKTLKFWKNWAVDFKVKNGIKKLQKEIDELNA